MNRVKKAAIYILLSAAILYVIICLSDIYFTQRELFDANERGGHYGPSEEILVVEQNPDGYGIVVGRLEDGGYSILEMKRKWGVFWGMPGGGIIGRHYLRQDVEVVFLSRTKCILIMSQNRNIKEVYFELRIKDGEDILYEKETAVSLDENGFAFLDSYDETADIDFLNDYHIYDMLPAYMEGRDADGNVIWELQRNL